MKVYNIHTEMDDELRSVLNSYRVVRSFNPESWVEEKTTLINAYFTRNKLSGAVLGVSGGIDSAVALLMLARAKKALGSNIEKIIPLLLPALDFDGATNQNAAISQAADVCRQAGVEPRLFKELTNVSKVISTELEDILGEPSTPWSRGQLVAYARTPVLYNATSILTEAGFPSLVIGTTNLSEGGYLGYVGKASDGMVDLQVVSDLYKSEVYAVARYLNAPESILQAIPTGDMYDGREDEEVFGASYDFVELYHLWLQNGSDPELLKNADFVKAQENIEKLHSYNGHKYTYHTPSIHLDILPAAIPGGWDNTPWRPKNVD